ncbi:MAG: adenylate/guanylate cyclase domain-containing protein [Pseudomonadota bacterium]
MSIKELTDWLVGEARLSGDGVAIVEELGRRLVDAGVPLWRLRVAQRVANPLLAAWGVIWRSDAPTEDYVVPTAWLDTQTWIGSPFEYVTNNRSSLRKRLNDLDPETDYHLYLELAAEGGTDFFCLPLEYGDGSVQGTSITTNHPDGFSDEHLAIFEAIRMPLASAMEPVAMRRSTASLLKTYLGKGPADEVVAGAVRRGGLSELKAVVMFSDLRGFTQKSTTWGDAKLLEALDQYFQVVVDAVHEHDGDVLKFLGDGVLAVFPILEGTNVPRRCADALVAARQAQDKLGEVNEARLKAGDEALEFGTALHLGMLTYGNIGSADRLDFTVIGETVNVASRIEGLCKVLGRRVLCSSAIAQHMPDTLSSLGRHEVRGVPEPVEVFTDRA